MDKYSDPTLLRLEERLFEPIKDLDPLNPLVHWIWVGMMFLPKGKKPPGVPVFYYSENGSLNYVNPRRWLWQHFHGPINSKIRMKNVCGDKWCVRPHVQHNVPSDYRERLARKTIAMLRSRS